MAEINKEIGLEGLLQGMGLGRTDSGGEGSSAGGDEKKGISRAEEVERVW